MRQRRSVAIIIISILAVSLGLGVASAVAQAPLPVGTSREEIFGAVIRNSRWDSTQMPIPVCWENPSASDAQYRNITRRAVQDTWEANGAVRFSGWGTCPTTSSGVRISIEDTGPHTKFIGRFLAGRPQGMVLNFTFQNWSVGCAANRDFCVYALAAHEFGHALGFTHEHNRPDAPASCTEPPQGSVGDYNVTRYDPDSIMNYCSERWNGDGQLSALDIEALQLFYGRR